jgi:oxidoreductase, zinc-binding dehydrogenase family
MKNLFRELFLGSLMLIINACELFSPKEWARFNREENMKGEVCHKNIWTDEIECRYKRPYCLKDSSGEVLECSSKPYN